MRFLFIISLFLGVQYQLQAQKTIRGTEIIEKIKFGESIHLDGHVIEGPLDFTTIEESFNKDKEEDGFFNRLFSGGDYQNFTCTVEVPVFFNNCRFEGPVIAYFHEGNSTYNANFRHEVTFTNCSFKDQAAFKYSHFLADANFSGSVFEEEGLFKYAQFRENGDFSNTVFSDVANFKYAKFPESASFYKVVFQNYTDFKYVTFPNKINFSNAVFKEEANFKYTHFNDEVTFGDAIFSGFANFKYTEFMKPVDFEKVEFSGQTDFKYSKVDGMEFSQYLLTQQ